ncbi:MAG TPA: MmgE/PrpD family protein [Thermodesulfobacteriota bacterium]|nr:MmgE/PrpD family protein [Thermodesulfobacteriota bacterium]
MGPTEKLARFVEATHLESIPGAVVEKAKTLILNVVGSMLAGSTEKTGRIGVRLVREAGGAPHATVVGGGFKTSALMAALANGISAHATDQDDTDWATLAHPTVAVLPAVLALGERLHAPGKKILEAYILGIEAEGKVGRGIYPMHHEMGFHSTGTLGHVGASVGSCKILGLGASQIGSALGIMGSLVSGIRNNVGSMTKPLHAGNAAHDGVLAASLAKEEFTSSDKALESRFGIARVFGGERASSERMVADLGEPYLIESPGITIKGNPCGTYGSVLVEGLQEMVKAHAFSADSIERIDLTLNPAVQEIMHYVYPRDAVEAKYAIPFIVAVTLTDGEAGLKQFTDEKTQDPKVREIISKIHMRYHTQGGDGSEKPSGVELSTTEIKITEKNGKVYTRVVDSARGYLNQPLSEKEILDRFRTFAGLVLPESSIAKTAEMVRSMETLADIAALMEAIGLTPGKV